MGAWGHRNFENDTATDYVRDFVENPSEELLLAIIVQAIKEAEENEYIDADVASEALAAAEIVAAALGRPGNDFPVELLQILKALPIWNNEDLQKLAPKAVKFVLKESELRELWAEGGESNEWQNVQKELLARLKRRM